MDFNTWIDALIYPRDTFGSLSEREKASLGEAIKNVGVAGLIFGVIAGLSSGLFFGGTIGVLLGGASTGIAFLIVVLISSIIIFPILSIIFLLVGSIILFIVAKILGGKGDFALQTYFMSLFLAPLTILSLLEFIPIIGLVIGILLSLYSLYPLTIALRETHEFGTGRAILTWLIPYLVIAIIFFVFGIILWQLGVFSTYGGGYQGGVNTARGFGKIKVFEPSIKYSGNTLEFAMMNGAGSSIENVEIFLDGSGCGNLNGVPDGKWGPGETASLTATCDELSPGSSFSVDVDIEYDMYLGETRIPHYEQGTIRGSVEAF